MEFTQNGIYPKWNLSKMKFAKIFQVKIFQQDFVQANFAQEDFAQENIAHRHMDQFVLMTVLCFLVTTSVNTD